MKARKAAGDPLMPKRSGRAAAAPTGRSSPVKPGKLVGPGDRTGKYMCIAFSAIDENVASAGAEPEGGESLWQQVRRGPCSRSMLYSCAGFVIPAAIHIYKHEHWMDWLAGFALLCVSVTSPLCDAFCVWSAVYEDGSALDGRYARTAEAVGRSEEWVEKTIQEQGAFPQVLATDRWNNLTRLIDRATCVCLVGPAVCTFAWLQRPRVADFLVVAGGFAFAWLTCALGQHCRMVYPCGIKRQKDGTVVAERVYGIYMVLHEAWHFLLITLFSASAMYRPAIL